MSDTSGHPSGSSRSPGSSEDLAARLSALWRQGQGPDLKEFLAGAGLLNAAELTDVLCTDQRQRWLHGQRPQVEAYIALHGSFHPGAEPAIDLIFGEFLARRELGESPTLDEYCRRFPKLAEQLRLHVELDALFPSDREVSSRDQGVLPRIPGYEVEAVLGQGGVGVVFRARHLRLGRLVAIKMLLAGAYAGPTELMRFQLEAEAVAGLCHPNIVQLYEIGEIEGRPYFTMEFVDGGSLAQKLAATPPANTGGAQHVRWAAELVATLAEAVSVAHRAGIIHRDLKPGNILLTAPADEGGRPSLGTPKISDFGLARRLKGEGDLTWTGTAVGTPSYMSPEQASDTAGPIGPATDVYGLGAVLYELLTGRPPFRARTPLETFRQVLSQEPVPPSRSNPRVPRDLETVCLKCLEKDPKRRYTSAAALAEDLQRYLQGQVVTARPVSNFERTVKWVRRNKWVASLSAVAALALVAGTVVSLVFAAEANRKAEELRQQTIELQAQTQRAEKNEKEIARVLVSGLSIPIGTNAHRLTYPLYAPEADALRQLRALSPALRVQFLEVGLRDRETARRIGRRADWIVQAIVGSDHVLRADVASLIVRRIQEPGASLEARFACTRLGLAVNVTDRAWAEHSANALLVTLRDPQTSPDDFPLLAEALAAVCEHLPPTQAADHASSALDIFFTSPRKADDYLSLGRGIVAISSRLDPATAARAAETLTAQLCQADCVPYTWDSLSTALVAVCRRLPASETDAHINRTIDFLIAGRNSVKENQGSKYVYLTMALRTLCGRLDPARASRVADAIVAILSDKQVAYFPTVDFTVLAQVAEFLDPPAGLRAAEDLVLVLRKTNNIVLPKDRLGVALEAVCRRLDVAGSQRVAEAMIAAARDPKSTFLVHTILADAFAIVAGHVTPAQAASLEDALVDSLLVDLGDTKARDFMGYVAKALGTTNGRPGAMRAAQVADALHAAIRDPQTPVPTLEPLTAALVVVCARLPPQEASSHRERALAVLDSLWNARTAPQDRARIAAALAVLWSHLDRADATARAQMAVAYLHGALRNPNLTTEETSFLEPASSIALALSAVYSFLEPAERRRQANSGADALLAALGNNGKRGATYSTLSQSLATMSAHLDQTDVVRIADALFALMDEFNDQFGEFGWIPSTRLDPLFKKVAVRLDERDLRRLLAHPLAVGSPQRILLDALPGAQKRSFRNLWHYLDDLEK